jgi:lipopolysaccharide biosynthesis regulator YciM
MPTESTFLLVGLLFLAAALGYFFARYGDDEEGDIPAPSSRLNADYIKGLNFLLNEQPDKALEVFMRMVEVDDETLETHFALGSLFRRRGEVDRAIRVHQNIIARPNLGNMHREHAVVSLAEDYLSAGLFDRAETLFKELRSSPEFQVRALQKLVRIYEVTHDWEPAIEAYRELEKLAPEPGSVDCTSHYYCELAENAVAERDFAKARELLAKALSGPGGSSRAQIAMAALAQETGDHQEAISIICDVMDSEPRLVGELVPRLAASCRAIDDQALLTRCLEKVRDSSRQASRAIALATIYDADICNATALECLLEYVIADPILSSLISPGQFEQGGEQERKQALDRIRAGLARLFPPGHRYSCTECGYLSSQLLWQCPGCRSWETVTPAAKFSFSSLAA